MRAYGERMAGVDLRHLMYGDVVGELIHACATELFTPRHPEQAELAHCLHVFPRKRGCLVQLLGDRRDMAPREIANHFPDLVVLFAEIQGVIHRSIKLTNRSDLVQRASRSSPNADNAVKKVAQSLDLKALAEKEPS